MRQNELFPKAVDRSILTGYLQKSKEFRHRIPFPEVYVYFIMGKFVWAE